MDDALLGLVLERLDRDRLAEEATNLLLAACEGDAQLADALGGVPLARPAPPPPPDPHHEPAGAYLTSVTVSGFRGIGPSATLPIPPGPGLTLVLGRNGSGKSSFAEGLEVLLTGSLRRWDDRAAVWQKGWRNLHDGSDPAIRAELLLEDKGRAAVERHWTAESSLDSGHASVQVMGDPRVPLEALGWTTALTAYRPFLSHAELETFLGRPSELHDLLAAVLGLDDLATTAERLTKARTQREASLTAVKRELAPLLDQLAAVDDARAAATTMALSGRSWNLEAARAAATGASGSADDTGLTWLRGITQLSIPNEVTVLGLAADLRAAAVQLDGVAGTASARSRDLAGLLTTALTHHIRQGDGDCPVCGRPGALDGSWHQLTEEAVRQLRQEAATAGNAAAAAGEAVEQALAVITPTPKPLSTSPIPDIDPTSAARQWAVWARVPASDDAAGLRALADHLERTWTPLAAALQQLVAQAGRLLAEREDRWAPVARVLFGWCESAAAAQAATAAVPVLKKAETWLKGATDDIRNARLVPIADHARAIWSQLRQESNVELGAIRLSGSRTRRDVDIDVRVDGSAGAALGVMSQGEVNALALSVFLPRATLPDSPFRFLVIDDPVQAMDPAKVDGLAQVLDEVARRRQVVVFTHDDRLAEAVRRFEIDATVLEVTRRPGSAVDVRAALDPVERALQGRRRPVRRREPAGGGRGTGRARCVPHCARSRIHRVRPSPRAAAGHAPRRAGRSSGTRQHLDQEGGLCVVRRRDARR